ncbi:MAG: 4'-phosphopantetheinyl transferase superfamily protein [Lachnospiraceae bacterium]|nr:4'-phosphopantetheinyl transferase superfamily protein [Lachnospiraceae bacterium]
MTLTVYYCNKNSISDSLCINPDRFIDYRANKIKNNRDKKLAYAAALVEEKSISTLTDYKTISITVSAHGKPVINESNVFYNMSHSKDVAVCVTSNEPIGIDIQHISKYNEGIAKKSFSEKELLFLNNAEDKDLAFTFLWAKRESYVKYTGYGLALGLRKDIPDNVNIKTLQIDDYVLCVCTEHKIDNIKLEVLSDF